MQRPGSFLAMPDVGNSYVVSNMPKYLLAAVRDGVEVTGELT